MSPNCRLEVRRCTVAGLDWQVTGGVIVVEKSILGGMIPESPPRGAGLHLWPDSRWEGTDNVYSFGSVRVEQKSFVPGMFEGFRRAVARDDGSRWVDPSELAGKEHRVEGIGADRK